MASEYNVKQKRMNMGLAIQMMRQVFHRKTKSGKPIATRHSLLPSVHQETLQALREGSSRHWTIPSTATYYAASFGIFRRSNGS